MPETNPLVAQIVHPWRSPSLIDLVQMKKEMLTALEVFDSILASVDGYPNEPGRKYATTSQPLQYQKEITNHV